MLKSRFRIDTKKSCEVALLKGAIGIDALKKAFSKKGGGTKEIEKNCNEAQQKLLARKMFGE